MKLKPLVIASTLIFAGAAQAAEVKPGLWEHTYKISSASGQIEQAIAQAKTMMAAMPPEQRQMIEQMLAKQGVSMDFTGSTVKMCLSETQAKNNAMPQLGEECTQEVLSQTDNEVHVRFDCKSQPPSSGEGIMRIQSETAYSGEFDLTTTLNGQPETLSAKTDGKWLGADCGGIAPVNNGQ